MRLQSAPAAAVKVLRFARPVPSTALRACSRCISSSRGAWLRRHSDFAIAKGADPDQARGAGQAVAANLDLLDPEADAELIRQAGFRDVELFYAAFTWRGWVGLA